MPVPLSQRLLWEVVLSLRKEGTGLLLKDSKLDLSYGSSTRYVIMVHYWFYQESLFYQENEAFT